MQAESMLLVRPEHLNHHGFLFGGRLLEWLDEQAYIATISHMKPEANLVTVGIDQVEFHHQVKEGAVLRFRTALAHVGKTSVTVHTAVDLMPAGQTIFEAYVTFVSLGPNRNPCKIRKYLLQSYKPTTKEEKERWEEVEAARIVRMGK